MENRLPKIFELACQNKRELTVREFATQFGVSTRTGLGTEKRHRRTGYPGFQLLKRFVLWYVDYGYHYRCQNDAFGNYCCIPWNCQ
ncbi:hypothetical protein [Lacrimispora amygdalina]|uniref:hypothetical protein n=1 Tax=Lacrimispora amygdalina TaxID=253257 RepID=UPI001FA8BFB1|nr:hypothetical protein [Clostridium indicum]